MTSDKKQRLALFLDGTWNTEEDSTNVTHAFHLTQEGDAGDGWIQKRYYDRGVGTGILEKVRGGGFGLGLEINVREAYNWLVDNYNDGDEIYIFGFSRGAYTVRSLVSFIASCGLDESHHHGENKNLPTCPYLKVFRLLLEYLMHNPG